MQHGGETNPQGFHRHFGTHGSSQEPTDGPDHEVKVFGMGVPVANTNEEEGLTAEGDIVSDMTIPSSGRGNSEDGADWVNPSPNQLYRALKRNNKPIDPQDAHAVSFVHDMVTDQSWKCVMEYENLHLE